MEVLILVTNEQNFWKKLRVGNISGWHHSGAVCMGPCCGGWTRQQFPPSSVHTLVALRGFTACHWTPLPTWWRVTLVQVPGLWEFRFSADSQNSIGNWLKVPQWRSSWWPGWRLRMHGAFLRAIWPTSPGCLALSARWKVLLQWGVLCLSKQCLNVKTGGSACWTFCSEQEPTWKDSKVTAKEWSPLSLLCVLPDHFCHM